MPRTELEASTVGIGLRPLFLLLFGLLSAPPWGPSTYLTGQIQGIEAQESCVSYLVAGFSRERYQAS